MKRTGMLLLAAVFVVAMVPASASAAECIKKITTYWGYNLSGGGVLCVLLGPQVPPEVVGQKIRECDGYTWSWGNTTCDVFTPTVDYEECPPCNQAMNEPAQDDVKACPAATVAE